VRVIIVREEGRGSRELARAISRSRRTRNFGSVVRQLPDCRLNRPISAHS